MPSGGFPQAIGDVVAVGLHALVDGRRHVDLEQYVDAAAQVETEAHLVQAQVAQPLGQPGRQRRRDVGFTRVLLAQEVAGRLLVFHRVEADDDATILQIGRLGCYVGILDDTHELPETRFAEIGTVVVGDLDRLDAAIDVR